MDRKEISEIIADWRAGYEGRIPKGKNKESLRAMTSLIEQMVKAGHPYENISSNSTAKQVERACVHQGPITQHATKQKRDSWVAKTKDDWDLAVRNWRIKHIDGKSQKMQQFVVAPGEDIDEQAKNWIPGNERKIEPIKPEEMLTDSLLKNVIPDEPLLNEEIEELLKADSGE